MKVRKAITNTKEEHVTITIPFIELVDIVRSHFGEQLSKHSYSGNTISYHTNEIVFQFKLITTEGSVENL